jgi:hypothetical protein
MHIPPQALPVEPSNGIPLTGPSHLYKLAAGTFAHPGLVKILTGHKFTKGMCPTVYTSRYLNFWYLNFFTFSFA